MYSRSKLFISFLVLICLAVLAVVPAVAQDEPLRVTYVVNGVLGDKSFIDSAMRGLDWAVEEYDIDLEVIELGIDPSNWETGLDDIMSNSDSYDILIVGSYSMVDYLSVRSHLYPDKTFFIYDAGAQYDNPDICVDGCKNVYSFTTKQNEGSFLVGVYTAAMTQVDLPGMNPEPILGAVGGGDIPVINDFIVGYEQGACLVNPETRVLVQYAGGWNDPARGKEITLAMYEQGADIVFQIAGATGDGVFEAALEQGRYAIGVDSDQAMIIMDSKPETAERILTSMMKNIDNLLYRAIGAYLDGTLVLGQVEELGIADGAVGLAYNDIYYAVTPENVQALIAAVEEAVVNGDITIVTAFGENPTAVNAGCDTMPETTFDASEYLGE
jgi:basic membrane protein A